jgi:hypothetical protein
MIRRLQHRIAIAVLAAGGASAGDDGLLRPIPADRPWCEVVAEAYRARIDGACAMELSGDGVGIASGILLERWVRHPAILPQGEVALSPDRHQATVHRAYFWNGGRLDERIEFTCRSIAIAIAYRPDAPRDTDRITYLMRFPSADGTPAPMTGGAYRFSSPGAVLEAVPWAESSPSLSSASVRDGRRQIDVLAEHQGRLFSWTGCGEGCLGLIDVGEHWDRPRLPAGESFRLGLLLWFAAADGGNLPATTLRIESP